MGYEVIRDGQGYSTRELQKEDIDNGLSEHQIELKLNYFSPCNK